MTRPHTLRSKRWQVAPPVPATFKQALPQIHPILLQILYNRGISNKGEIQAFLDGRYLNQTDPFLLADVDKAVTRIQYALDNEETIIIYGDFDADGVTSTVLLTQALRGLGASRRHVQPYIPDRIDEGYGLNKEALTTLKEKGADLVISVDCGIRSVAEVAHAQQIGLDMIITDHHSLGPQLPPAVAIINPKRPDSAYPEKMLAGVGIAYKLAEALYAKIPARADMALSDCLDLVALGTVADLAPLLGENRKLVHTGLQVLNRAERPGVAALAKISGVRPGHMTAETIAFALGPRINAAGRIGHAYDAARLLAVNNQRMAADYASKLNRLNQRRQRLTAQLSTFAESLIDLEAPILIAADDSFAPGVVGLVASRLADKYYRPAIVIEKGEEESRGSCRSIPGFHITEALDETADLLERHGGHAQAAGFTLQNDNLADFIARITEIAAAKTAHIDLQPTLAIDMVLPLEAIDWAVYENLALLEPTGYANATPVFMSERVEVRFHRAVGQDGSHLQLRLATSNRRQRSDTDEITAIAFRQGAWAKNEQMPQFIDIVYTISVNEWRGKRSLQLIVQDIRRSQA